MLKLLKSGLVFPRMGSLIFHLVCMLYQLDIHIQGIDIPNFEARMQEKTKPTYTSIVQHTKEGKPALVFVQTWKHAQHTALDMVTYSNADGRDRSQFVQCTKQDLTPFIA